MNRRLAAHTNTYHTYTLDDALDGIAGAGFRAVELSAVPGWTEHVTLDAGSELRRRLDAAGLEPVLLSAHSDLTTPEGVEYGVAAVRWAAEFGIPVVNTAIGGHASHDEDEEAFLRNIGALADAAEAAGVVVALEIHGEIMASGARSRPLIERIGREAIKVNYDTANVEFYGGVKAVDDLPAIAPYLASVHLKDTVGGKGVWNFPALGEGSVDFAGVVRVLDEAGYTGPLSVELEFEGEPWPPLDEVNRSMRASYELLSGLGLAAR
jgi:L-ribulose-5-phosphate 3-epimerase